MGAEVSYDTRIAPLLLHVEEPPGAHVGAAEAMVVLPDTNQRWHRLREAGYSVDPKEGEFTGFLVTASTDLLVRGKAPRRVIRPSRNTLHRWRDVRAVS